MFNFFIMGLGYGIVILVGLGFVERKFIIIEVGI